MTYFAHKSNEKAETVIKMYCQPWFRRGADAQNIFQAALKWNVAVDVFHWLGA